MARSSSPATPRSTFKGKAVDVKQVGRELNVRYVLEGSVQRSGNRLRVNVQLIDAETGNHLWAERFDKPVADLFDMQDEIVSRLANTLNAQLIEAEATAGGAFAASRCDGFDFQGMAWLNKGLTPEHLTQARGFFERALALDPRQCRSAGRHGSRRSDNGGALLTDDRAARLFGSRNKCDQSSFTGPAPRSGPLDLGWRLHFYKPRGPRDC